MRIGVIGGGQLAQMLALAGYPLGFKVICLEPNRDCPATLVTEVIEGNYDNPLKLQELTQQVDVLTYEFENISVAALQNISEVAVYPPPSALAIAQDRLHEKQTFQTLNIPTTNFVAIETFEDLQAAVNSVGLPCVLKTRRFGYDGKGQCVIRNLSDMENAWQQLKNQPLLLENLVSFDREVSCIAVRSSTGECCFYPLIENQHCAGILHLSQVLLENSSELQQTAEKYMQRLMNEFNYVGVFTVEFFEKDGQLIANEMAPRVHNSGHWTIEGAQTSQFENHLRAIAGLPLGSVAPMGNCAMLNLVGSVPALQDILQIPEAHCHLYGKEARLGRKLGHVTICVAKRERYEEVLLQLQEL